MARNDLIILQRGSQGLRSLLRTPGLVACYLPWLDGSGQTLTDWTGLGNDRQLGSTAGADADDPTWGTGGKWLEFDGIDDILADGPTATTVWSLLGDDYGNALGWVRGKRTNVAGRFYAELRFDREIGVAERRRIFRNVEAMLKLQGVTGTFYDWAYPIPCTAGTMDFSITNADDLLWVAPDGTTSTAVRPQFEHASQQTSWAFCSNWDAGDLEIDDNDTNALYIGDLADLPPVIAHYLDLYNCSNITGDLSDVSGVTYYLRLYNCTNVTGDLSDVSGVTYYLNLTNCANITGDLSDVSGVTYYLRLYNCTNVTGDLSDVSGVTYLLDLSNCTNVTGDLSDVSGVTYLLNLTNCANITGDLSDVSGVTSYLYLINCADITGTLNPKASLKYIYLNGTGITETQLDNSIIAVNTVTTVVGEFKWSTGVRSVASDDAYDALATAGWTLTEREW
jgi:hypothetical protein